MEVARLGVELLHIDPYYLIEPIDLPLLLGRRRPCHWAATLKDSWTESLTESFNGGRGRLDPGWRPPPMVRQPVRWREMTIGSWGKRAGAVCARATAGDGGW